MKVNKQKLQEALEIVKPGLSNKDTIEQATSFAFMKDRVVTYNDEISISHPVDGLELEGAVIADKLYALLTKLKKDDLDIEVKENELVISSGRSKAGLTFVAEIKLPLEKVEEKSVWKPLPKGFIKFLKFAMASCGKDASRPILSGVNVTKEGILESSDGYRIVQCTMEEEMPVQGFLLPATAATHIVKLEPTMIAEGKGWVRFKTEGNTVISSRILAGKYPNINSIVGMVDDVKLVLPKTTSEVLERAAIFAKRDSALTEEVLVSIADNKLKMKAIADSGEGWFEEDINYKYSDTPIEFAITPTLLKSILGETQECTIDKKKIKFVGNGWFYLIMLRNVKQK